MSKWSLLYKELTRKHDYIKLNPPATPAQVSKVEKTLDCKLPDDLKDLLLEMNGDNWFIFSTEKIIETNQSIRSLECYMPLDCILFFAGNGCGDYYGYPITREDGVRSDSIFFWDHEYDNRAWKASDLKVAIQRYYAAEI